jgi:glycogen debranching enzyme
MSLPPISALTRCCSGADLLSLGGSLVHNSGCAQPAHLSSFGSRNLLVHWGLDQPTILRAPSPPPCIFFDITHDNESPVQSRGCGFVANVMTMVSTQTCAVGSTRGVEELIPHKISVVDERRLYPIPALDSDRNFWPLRKALFALRSEMQDAGYDTCHVAAVGPLVVIRRVRKVDLSQHVFIIRSHGGDGDAELPAVHLDGNSCSVKFSFTTRQRRRSSRPSSPAPSGSYSTFEPAPSVSLSSGHGGLPQHLGSIACARSSVGVHLSHRHFVEGCVLALHVSLGEEGAAAAHQCKFKNVFEIAQAAVQAADEHEVAYALFCCDPEERALSHNARGCYAVDGHVLTYAGIHGFCSAFDAARSQSRVNMDERSLAHFQQGLWALDFTSHRLKDVASMRGLVSFYNQISSDISESLPPSHWPCALDSIFCATAHALHHRLLSLCGGNTSDCPRRLVCCFPVPRVRVRVPSYHPL